MIPSDADGLVQAMRDLVSRQAGVLAAAEWSTSLGPQVSAEGGLIIDEGNSQAVLHGLDGGVTSGQSAPYHGHVREAVDVLELSSGHGASVH